MIMNKRLRACIEIDELLAKKQNCFRMDRNSETNIFIPDKQ